MKFLVVFLLCVTFFLIINYKNDIHNKFFLVLLRQSQINKQRLIKDSNYNSK